MTVNELIAVLQELADPDDGGYGNAQVYVLVGSNDVRAIPHGAVDEWYSNSSVWIKVRDEAPITRERRLFRKLMDEFIGEALT